MKTLKMVIKMAVKIEWILGLLLAVGCAQSSNKVGEYRNESRTTLESLARGVSGSFNAKEKSRGAVDYSSYFGGNNMIGTSIFNPDMNADTYDCMAQVQGITPSAQSYLPMVAKFSQCLNRLLVEGNPLMSYGYRNMDPMGQNYYAYLLNWRRFGTLENFSSGDFGVLSQFAGQGYYPLGSSGFRLTPQ